MVQKTVPLLAVLLALLFFNGTLFGAGLRLIPLFQEHRSQLLLGVSKAVDLLCDIQVTVAVLMLFYSLRHGPNGQKLFIRSCWALALISLGKLYFKESRPYWISDSVQNLAGRNLHDYGNPSGHTALIVVTIDNLILAKLPNAAFPKRLYYLILVGTLVGLTRLYLGVHSLNQVLLGGVLGLVVACLDSRLTSATVFAGAVLTAPLLLLQLPQASEQPSGGKASKYLSDTLRHFYMILLFFPLLFYERKPSANILRNNLLSLAFISVVTAQIVVTAYYSSRIESVPGRYALNVSLNLGFSYSVYKLEDRFMVAPDECKDKTL